MGTIQYQSLQEFFERIKNKNIASEKAEQIQEILRDEMKLTVRDYLESSSPFSNIHARLHRGSSSKPWFSRSRRLNNSNFYGVFKFLKFKKNPNSLSWGYGTKRGVSFETGQKTRVTDPMRRLFGMQRSAVPNPKVGINIFPLKASTKYLDQPPRPFLTMLTKRKNLVKRLDQSVGNFYSE